MNTRVVLLHEEELKKYREDLVQCMNDSLKVSSQPSDSKMDGNAVYEKMMGYYRMGKTNILGALDDRGLVGYAQFFQKEDGRVHLNQIAVREACQGQGVGALLIQEVENGAKGCNADTLELFCNETNTFAKKFYQKHKFLTEKRLMVKNI